jgi:hypothetical protein
VRALLFAAAAGILCACGGGADAAASTRPGEGLNPQDRDNPWALFDDYIDRVAARCVDALTPGWSTRLAAFDVYAWDQCYAMEQSLRIE